jgi:ureidoacrylate peracid hydrolase
MPAIDLADMVAPASTALLVIDVQNDYLSPEGWFGRTGVDVSSGAAMLPRLLGLIDTARSAGVAVIYTRNWHRPETDSAAWLDKLARSGQSADDRPGRAGTWGAEFYCVAPAPGEEVVSKFRYDAFLGTNLDYLLRVRGVTAMVCAGTTTNVCVESTARSGHLRDYHVVLVEDCCSAPDPGEHAAAIRNVERYFGRVVQAADVAAVWGAAVLGGRPG